MIEKDKIYLTKDGFEQFLLELEELKERLANNGKGKSSVYTDAVGDGWHDNFDFDEAKRQELKIISLIERKVEQMKSIVIIDETPDNHLISVDDYVDVDIIHYLNKCIYLK